MVVACLGLAISLGGTGYAVSALPKGSVGTAQLRGSAVTSAKVRNRSLTAVDFAKGQLPTSPQGSVGAPGPRGDAGPAGQQGPAGPQGRSGVLSGLTATGGSPNPNGTVQFLGAPVTVTIPSTSARVLVVAENGFGAGGLGGNELSLHVCYQHGSGPVTKVGNGIVGLRLPANTRVPMGINKILSLAPGTYTVGMCGSGGTGWTNNDWGTTTALVFETL
jgi:hypothetical protein